MKTAGLVSGLFIVAGCSPHAHSPVSPAGVAQVAAKAPEQVLPSLKGVADVRRLAARTRRGGEILQIGGAGMAIKGINSLFVHAGLQRVYATARRGWQVGSTAYVWRGPTSELQWEGRFDRIALRPSTGGFWGEVPRLRSSEAHALVYVTPTFGRQEVETEEFLLPTEHGAVSHDGSMFAAEPVLPFMSIRVSRLNGPREKLDVDQSKPKNFDYNEGLKEETSYSMRFVEDDSAVIVATNQRIFRWQFASDGRVSNLYVSDELDLQKLAAAADVAVFFENGQPWLFDWQTGQTTDVPLPFQFADEKAKIQPSDDVKLEMSSASLALSPHARYLVLLGQVRPIDCHPTFKRDSCEFQSVNGVYEVATGRETLRLPAEIRRAEFSEIDEVLAVADSKKIYWVDLRTPKPMAVPTVQSTRFVAWHDAGKALLRVGEAAYFVFGVTDYSLVSTKHVEKGPHLERGLDNPEWVVSIDRGKKGLLVGYNENFSCKDGGHLWIKARDKPARTYRLLEACKGWNDSDDRFTVQNGVVVSLRFGQNAEVFDAEAGIRLAEIQSHVQADYRPDSTQSFLAAVSHDGRMIAVIDYANRKGPVEDRCQMPKYSFETNTEPPCWGYDYLLRIFRVPTVASAGTAPTLLRVDELGSGLPTTLAFADDDRNLLVGFENGSVTIHPSRDTAPFRREELHRGAVMRFEFAPGGRLVMSRDEFGQELLWQP